MSYFDVIDRRGVGEQAVIVNEFPALPVSESMITVSQGDVVDDDLLACCVALRDVRQLV